MDFTVDDVVDFALEYLNIVVQPHQRRWLEHLINGGPRVLLLAPRGHGKTTTVIEVLLVFMICHCPDIKILLASHKESVARRQARMVQIHLERKRIREDFKITKGSPWRRDEFYIRELGQDKAAPTVYVVAGQGGMTGYRFDWIIFDDLLTMDNTRTETSRYKLLEWIENEVFKARDPGLLQKTIVVGTRKHHKDWYSMLIESKFYTHHVDRAIQEDGSVLWPYQLDKDGNRVQPMYTLDELNDRRSSEGPRSFAQEYQNEPSPPEGMAFKREWLRFYDELPPHQFLDIYMGIDPSGGSTEDRASSLAVAVIAHDRRVDHGQIYILELYKDKLTLGEQLKRIQHLSDKWKPQTVNVESVLYNKEFSDRIIDRIPNALPIDYIHTRLQGTTEKDKERRIRYYIGIMFEDGQVLLRDPAYDYQTREFIETEYIVFPAKDGEKDLLDALTLAVDLAEMMPGAADLPLHAF